MSRMKLARSTMEQLAEALEVEAAEHDQEAADARERAQAIREAIDSLPNPDAEGNPFETHILVADRGLDPAEVAREAHVMLQRRTSRKLPATDEEATEQP